MRKKEWGGSFTLTGNGRIRKRETSAKRKKGKNKERSRSDRKKRRRKRQLRWVCAAVYLAAVLYLAMVTALGFQAVGGMQAARPGQSQINGGRDPKGQALPPARKAVQRDPALPGTGRPVLDLGQLQPGEAQAVLLLRQDVPAGGIAFPLWLIVTALGAWFFRQWKKP